LQHNENSYVVIYRNGVINSLVVDMHENLFDHLQVSVRDCTLYIDSDRAWSTASADSPRFYVYAPFLETASFSGAVSSGEWDIVSSDSFTLDIGGASLDIDMDVDVFRLDVSGASGVSAAALETTSARVELNGAGSINIYCSGTLDVTINGVGSVNVYGNPTISESVSGLGSVNRR